MTEQKGMPGMKWVSAASAGLAVDAAEGEDRRPSWERRASIASLLAPVSDREWLAVLHPPLATLPHHNLLS